MKTSNLVTAIELTPKVVTAISETNQISAVLSKVARTARLMDGAWIPELVTNLPGVKQSFQFFGAKLEQPVASMTRKALTCWLNRNIRKQLESAQSTSMGAKVISTIASQCSTFLPGWTQAFVPTLASALGKAAIDQLSNKMSEILEPLICVPTAELIAKNVLYIARESAKMYVGHQIQYMLMAYCADQLRDSEYKKLSTGLDYAKQADDYRVYITIFALMLTANIAPYVCDKLFHASEKDRIKTNLHAYILEKSSIDSSTTSGYVYSVALKGVVSTLVESNVFDLEQIKVALSSIQLAEQAVTHFRT